MASSLREFPRPVLVRGRQRRSCGFLGIGTVLPGLAPHVRHDLGGSDETVGFVIGIFSFVALGARYLLRPSRRHARPQERLPDRPASAARSPAPCISRRSASRAYISRGAAGIRRGFPLYRRGHVGDRNRGRASQLQALGYVSSGIWGGMSAGPVLGSWVGSFQHAALMQTILALAGFALLVRVPERYKPHPHARKAHLAAALDSDSGLRRWDSSTCITR